MNLFDAILLGIIQGLTEFLPVSSTAHLTIAGRLLGLIDPARPEDWTAFIAMMQLGTVAAVIIYFFKDLRKILLSLVKDSITKQGWSGDSRLAGQIILGTLPVAVIGLSLKKIIEGSLTKELSTMGTSLVVLALFLFWAEKVGKRNRTLATTTWVDALVVGCAQAMALVPGSSRSGTTITAGLFMGLEREAAARFSFLLSIPAVIASGFFEFYEVRHHILDLGVTQLVASTCVAFVVGYATIAFLLRYLKTHTTFAFIYYRIILGIVLWVAVLL
jgi:undecaprenyl-diphosphatase